MQKTKHMERWLVATPLCLIGLASLCGCALFVAGGAAGIGTAAYIKGKLSEQVDASPMKTRNAIEKAARHLELKELKADADGLSGDYIYKTGSDEKINVRYEKMSETSTQLTIRVGLFGDENMSRVLLDEIKRHL